MTGSRFVVDIRRHRGDPNFIIQLVGRFCSGLSGAAVEWLVRPDQASLLPPDQIIGQADPYDGNWAPRVCERLAQYHRNTPDATGGTFGVLSYDNNLLGQVERMNPTPRPLTTIHLGQLYRMGSSVSSATPWAAAASGIRPPGTWPNIRPPSSNVASFIGPAGSPFLTSDEAVALAKEALRRGGHTGQQTALPQKDLRPAMSHLDSRAIKRYGDRGSEMLITDIVDRGMQEGWLRRFRRVPEQTGTEALYLVQNGESEAEPMAALREQRGATTEATPAATAAPRRQQPAPVEQTPTVMRPPEVAAPAILPEASEAPDSPAVTQTQSKKHPNRATEFEAILSKSRIGSLPETRELMFDAIEAAMAELRDSPPLLPELFVRATERARGKAQEVAYCSEKNWPVAERCIRRLMLWAGVLLNSQQVPIPDTIGCNSTRVASIKADFRRICEAFQAEHIIVGRGGINYDDDPYYLGLTLYRRGRAKAVAAEELKAKADEILTFLLGKGKIEMDGDRTIRIKTSDKAISTTAR